MKHWLLIFLFCFSVLPGFSQSETMGGLETSFDSCATKSETKSIVVGNILLEGNQVTKDKIILREILFQSGDTLSCRDFCGKVVKSRQNLLNRSIFNFVQFDTIHDLQKPEMIHIRVDVTERWYIWPLPIFELADRNLNAWWETKDFRRANYGVFLTYNNFRGRLEQLKLLLRAGYNQNYYLQYEIPYLTKAQTLGMGIQLGYALSREVPYITLNNKQLFYRSEDGYGRKEWYAKVKFSYRKGIHNSHSLSLGFEKTIYDDTLLIINPSFMQQRSGRIQMVHLSYYFKHDFRDSKPYPLEGHYADVEFNQFGFGLLEDEPLIATVKTTVDMYRKISRKWYWAASLSARISAPGEQPYFMQRALGYGNDFVRSYEVYVVDGTDFAVFKTNLKFALINPQKRQIPFIGSEKFSKIHYALYLNWLFDAGYARNPDKIPANSYQNRLLYGTGVGLDLVTYYDLVWRFEYSVNQFGKGGFFIHFVAPI